MAVEHDKIKVRRLPERIKEITKNVTKKTQAVPKSFMRKRQPIHMAENTINPVKFLVVCSSSKVDVPTKINAIFINSDG